MRAKRFLAAFLTAALALSLLVLPASAAPGSFSDVTDPATAVNADILRLMGVVTGTGGNQFNPNGTLTRAEFCALVIRFLQREEEAQRYATRTIFSDVKSTHWARKYVNMAASVTLEEGGAPLVAGVGDGRFLPDSQITLAEAVTILLRALGYSGQQAGAVWPQGYLDLAASINLTDGLPGGANAVITRAQAAQLFVNALKCKKADGQVYYKTLGTLADPENKTIILAVNVETDDGSSKGALRTSSNESSEAYLPAQGEGNTIALQGRRGDLVLNDRQEIVTFIPDDSTATTITLSGDAQAAYVKASGGRQYAISANTPVYTTAAGEAKRYSEAFSTLVSGAQVTLYSEKGKIVAVYATSGTTTAESDAVVVMGTATAATFHQLTGGVGSFNIVKNRQSITLSQIKPYDVVTYDQMTNTLVVSDLRLTCVYKDAAPNAKTPRTINVTGSQQFEVLESAWDTCGDFKIGDNVTLLLTADGKVAGMAKTDSQTRSTAIGFVDGGKVEMFLPNGLTMELKDSTSNSNVDGQLVTISYGKDRLNASRLNSRTAPGAFQVNGMKLGSYTVSPGVRVYEQVSGGAMAAIDRGDLAMESIPADKIAAYHLNSSDAVDYIVLNNVTGDAYEYGMMVSESRTIPASTDDDGTTTPEHTVTNWKLVRNGTELTFTSGYNGRSGDMVGVVTGKPMGQAEYGDYTIKAIVQLTEVKNVKPSDFFESGGVQHVTVNGRTYRVANDVECCRNISGNRSDASNWLSGTGAERLANIKAYSNDLTIYVDPVGQQVRIIKAN